MIGTRRRMAASLRAAVRTLRPRRGAHRRIGLFTPSGRRALAQLRRELHGLPETRHPLGL